MFVKAGDVKLLLSFFREILLGSESVVLNFFLNFLSFFLISLSSSLVNSNGLIVTLIGDVFCVGLRVVLVFLCCGGVISVELGLCGAVMMAPSLLYRILERRGTFSFNTSGSDSDDLSHSEHCLLDTSLTVKYQYTQGCVHNSQQRI